MSDMKTFLKYVIPSVLAFALSGVYAIVDGFFVGNSVGDIGLSAINVAYPISAVIQAIGTGIGMGGAVCYSINKAENREKEAKQYMAGSIWLLLVFSAFMMIIVFVFANPLLKLLGAQGELLSLGKSYIKIISIGAGLQIVGTGLIPFIRNNGNSFYAMVSMVTGFVSNIILDYLFIWVKDGGIEGAAWATIISQGITMIVALVYLLRKKQLSVNISKSRVNDVSKSIIKIGIAPFGLAMTPNISLMIINRFSISYGGEKAIATYACISYIICIVYLVLQGVGDGSQPLMSQYYGEKKLEKLKNIRKLAYGFAVILSIFSCIIMYVTRWNMGITFGASNEVNNEIGKIIPIFLVSVPFVAINRITTASFYATEKSLFSYVLTFIEPILMLILMIILPPLFGGQLMIWWSTVFARIISAILALILKQHTDRQELYINKQNIQKEFSES